MNNSTIYSIKKHAKLITAVNSLSISESIDREDLQLPEREYAQIILSQKNNSMVDVQTYSEKGLYGPKIQNSEEGRLVFFAVHCKEEKPLVVFTHNDRPHKFWMNNKFIGVDTIRSLYILNAIKGINYFAFEYKPNEGDSEFQVRINTLDNEKNNQYTSCVTNCVHMHYNQAVSLDFDYQWNTPAPYRFMLTLRNHFHIDKEKPCEIEVFEYDEKTPIFTDSVHFYQPHEVDMSQFNNNQRLLRLKIHYYDKEQNRYTITKPFFFGDVAAASQTLRERCHSLFSDSEYSLEEKLFLKHELEQFSKKEQASRVTAMEIFFLADAYATVVSKRYIKRFSSPGWVPIYYYSTMDCKLHKYSVCLPQNFEPNKKYPLLIRYQTLNNSTTAPLYADNGLRDIIVVDMPLRGVTLGSYIGEASFKEVLANVISRYKIDDKRIYASGYSNGAYATWLLAEIYPSLFAGIVSYAGGMDKKKIKNLYNIPILRVESQSDHRYKREGGKYTKGLKKCPYYNQLYAEAYTHPSLDYVTLNLAIIQRLLEHEKNEFPDVVYYRTDKNRHLCAYWVQIQSIAPSKAYGEVEASVQSGDIYVKTKNITGIKITIPPQADKIKGCVFINGKKVTSLSACSGDSLCFLHKKSGFVLVPELERCKLSHGAGLLDIFMDSMKIVNCDQSDPLMNKTALSFSQPQTQSYTHTADVIYPIIPLDRLDQNIVQNSGLVIIDNNQPSEFLSQLRNKCPVKTTAEGFQYKEDFYAGDYCVMQIIQNPFNENYNVLYLNTNNPTMYSKNIFTRNLIVPTYVNGKHPYLNNDILIYHKNQYFVVFDKDDNSGLRVP